MKKQDTEYIITCKVCGSESHLLYYEHKETAEYVRSVLQYYDEENRVYRVQISNYALVLDSYPLYRLRNNQNIFLKILKHTSMEIAEFLMRFSDKI